MTYIRGLVLGCVELILQRNNTCVPHADAEACVPHADAEARVPHMDAEACVPHPAAEAYAKSRKKIAKIWTRDRFDLDLI